MIQLMKNNVGDRTFENEPDRYSKPIRCVIYFFVGFATPFVVLWKAGVNLWEAKRIGDKNIHL